MFQGQAFSWLRLGYWITLLWIISYPAVSQQSVYYPRPESTSDVRLHYPIALLELCLQKAGSNYQLKPSAIPMQQGRSLRLLQAQQGIDVVWTSTTKARETELLAVRIPIDRGLMGWRLLLINEQDQNRFAGIQTTEDLMALRAGQGHDWPDLEILATNHFKVQPSATYDGLFHMLARQHIDYIPRSALEIQHERDTHQALGLLIEPHLVIHYPAALYYFVHKDNPALAQAITTGLELAINDGTLRALFDSYYQPVIEKAKLATRKKITLPNPLLPDETPLTERRYWFTPEDYPQ